MSMVTDILLAFVKLVIYVFDFITFPIYSVIYRPWIKTAGFRQVRSRRIDVQNGEVTYRAIDRPSKPKDDFLNHPSQIRTMDQAFAYAFEKHSSRRCLGTREIIREEKEKTPDGRILNKLIMGDYSWHTYSEVDDRSDSFGKGLRYLGLQQREKLVIYMDTKADWLMAAIGCFKFNFPIVTIYTNLGESGVQYGISQTQAEYVLVSQELFPKLCNVLKEIPHVKTIIIYEEPHKGRIPSLPDGVDVRMKTFNEVIELGQSSQIPFTPPVPDDIGIIMYTSGSTGNPKGVVLTHFNLVNCLLSLIVIATHAVGKVRDDDIHIGFLPLAHVLELLSENAYIILGVPIGYSSPYTLIDTSIAIKSGERGDAIVLKPTLMCAVPVILDRIYKGINKKIDDGGEFKSKLVRYLIKYRDRWIRRGFDTPIAKFLIFNKMQAVVGGKIRMLLCGGAPLADEAHVFIRTCLCGTLLNGYGLTETGAVACVSDERDILTGRVGPPLCGVDIKLIDWEEGGYRVTDSVGPRGEIVVGGKHVAKGYYNMPEETDQNFFEENGKRWFKTGDIGQYTPEGTFKIIDRKKDLVKLQMGEYVALGKVESCLKLHPVVENICVCARSTERTTVALIVPDQDTLEKIGEKLNKTDLPRSALCKDPDVKRELLKTLTAHGISTKLERFEIPKGITLIEVPWTPDSGMVTSAFKLKRKTIEAFYKTDIDRMYDVINEEYGAKPKKRGWNRVGPI